VIFYAYLYRVGEADELLHENVVVVLSRASRGGVHGPAHTLRVRPCVVDLVEAERRSSAVGG